MYGPLLDSSPLSSPKSPMRTPPSVWYTGMPPAMKSGGTPLTKPKLSSVPLSPGSTKSTASNTSKKRSRTEFDESSAPEMGKAPKQRKKGAASKPAAPKKPVVSKKPAKQAPPTPRANTRPSRDRKAPERYVDVQETPKKPATPRKASIGTKTWQAKYVTESYRSRLCKVDVYHMLLKQSAWTGLSPMQKRELFTLLPKTSTNERLYGELEAGKAGESVRPLELQINCSEFRTDVAAYLADLSAGLMTRTWQEGAKTAMLERAKGTYDDWKEEESETWWGQK